MENNQSIKNKKNIQPSFLSIVIGMSILGVL